MIAKPALIICLCLICAEGSLTMALAQNIQYGQANQQDMLRRSRELTERSGRDTREATKRMRRILQEKREGQRGLSKDFMNRQGSASEAPGQ